MQLIDTHTHLSDEAYTEGGAAMVEAAIAAGVVMMILPGTSLEELPAMKRLAAQFPRHLRMFAGLHPTELTADPEAAVAVIRREIEENPGLYVGVGEIGIDLHESPHDADRQMRAFDAQCRIALDHGLPVNIHCRDGLDEALEVLRGLPQMPSGAFHCFGGTTADVEKIRSAGDFYFGINGIVTFKNSGLRSTLPAIGLDRIILETDSPYLTPAPFRGKRNDSSYLPLIARCVADTLGLTPDRVAGVTTASARSLYHLN